MMKEEGGAEEGEIDRAELELSAIFARNTRYLTSLADSIFLAGIPLS